MALTKEEARKLCDALLGTSGNVYRLAPGLIGRDVGDEVFDDLADAGIFRCELCDDWLMIRHRDSPGTDICSSCANDYDEED